MKGSVVRRLSSVVQRSTTVFGSGLLAILLALPALGAGVQFDDYYHREVLLSAASPAGPMQALFAFLDGDVARTRALMDSGAFPWWTLPNAREAFWRPLAALTHWLDYQLWPEYPALMHAHSLLWLGSVAAAAAALYRRLAPSAAVAGLAALLYAVDDAHGFAAGWLANRNGLMAALFGLLGVLAFARWRREAWRPGAWLTPLWLALGLLSAEAALGAVAYLAAYSLCLDRAPWRQRAASLAPAALVVALWAAAYRAQGFGAWGTAYVDPLREPLAFAGAVLERGPILLLAQFAYPPAELYPFLGPGARLAWWAAAVVMIAALAWLFAPLLRRSPTARFWAVGMGLALLPVCAALPANRLLWWVGVGGMGLVGEFLAVAFGKGGFQSVLTPRPLARLLAAPMSGVRVQGTMGAGQERGSQRTERTLFALASGLQRSVVRRLSSVVLFIVHLVIAPLLLPLTAYSPALLGNLEPAALSVPAEATGTVVVVNAPSFFTTSFLGTIREAQGLPAPARVRYLGAGPAALELERADARTLIVRPAGGYLTGFDTVFRGLHHPLAVGEVVEIAGMQAEVLALTVDGRPAAVAFGFDVPLEDPSLHWFEWRGGVLAPLALPAVGEVVGVPALPLLGAGGSAP